MFFASTEIKSTDFLFTSHITLHQNINKTNVAIISIIICCLKKIIASGIIQYHFLLSLFTSLATKTKCRYLCHHTNGSTFVFKLHSHIFAGSIYYRFNK